jgi:2-dehydropantoate 2-reductase
MKIAVFGAGGVGGYFGGRLAAAGEEVTFIARGAHLAAIHERGLKIVSPAGDVQLPPGGATDNPAEIGPVDAVLFAVKLYDVDAAAEASRPMIGPDTVVVSLQNGVDAEERMQSILGAGHVAGGVAEIGANISEPGTIVHKSSFARMIFGALDGGSDPRLERLCAACAAAGIDASVTEDIQAALWVKFIMLSSFSALTSLLRLPAEYIRDDAEIRAVYVDALKEAEAVARARGVNLPDGVVQRTVGFLDGMPNGMKASMLVDLEQGRRLELASLSGAVVRFAADLDVAVPVHRTAYAALKPWIDGVPGN